jgi:hypothetical protein
MKKQKLKIPNLSYKFSELEEDVSLIFELSNIEIVKRKKFTFTEINLKTQKLRTNDSSTRLF